MIGMRTRGATPYPPPTQVNEWTKASVWMGVVTAIATVVTAFFPTLHVAAFGLAAATFAAGVVTVVLVMRGKGTLLERLVTAVEDAAQIIVAVVNVLPKAVEREQTDNLYRATLLQQQQLMAKQAAALDQLLNPGKNQGATPFDQDASQGATSSEPAAPIGDNGTASVVAPTDSGGATPSDAPLVTAPVPPVTS